MFQLIKILFGFNSKLKRINNKYKTTILSRSCKSIGYSPQIAFPITTYGLENVTIGDNFKSGERLKTRTFSEWGNKKYSPVLKIGDNVSLESDCHISAVNRVEIGDNVLMASFVYISDHSHGEVADGETNIPPLERPLYSKGPIIIGNNVWIGEKVCILPNVRIGDGSVIGAGSVVTKDIPSGSVAVGNPAKVIRKIS